MVDEPTSCSGLPLDRRSFVSGLTSLAAASALSLSLAEETAAKVDTGTSSMPQTLESPDGRVEATIDLEDGVPVYSVAYDGQTVVEDSMLGFEFATQAPFGDGIRVTGTERTTYDDTWEPLWDQYDEIREHYRALRIGFEETGSPGRSLTLEFRAFDDGLGFRYVFPENGGFGDFTITAERTEFAFAGDYTAWWIENDFNSYEYEYTESVLSEIGDLSPFGGAHTPMTMRADENRYVSIHEANLVDYAGMGLEPVSPGATTFESVLAPMPDGSKVTAAAPHRTPWRTIQVADRPGALVESNLVVNLNEPFDADAFPKGTDFITPQKFLGVWWMMITGRADWEYNGPETGNHGAQTGRMKRYMDFASEHDIPSVLVEGWNEGWDSFPGDGTTMDFDDPYPDFDLREVTEYGLQLDPPVEMTSHNETSGNFVNYEAQLDDSPNPFALYEELGIRSIKTGYVADDGMTVDGKTYNHHCQALVNHHHLVYQEAANHRQMLEVHEPIKPTGERRTYPNVMTREGVLGQEYDSFGYVSPDHHVTFPFTRMLGGPVEYTPGIFDMDSGSGGIETTRAKQLAMYPTYFSGLHMVADLPSSYLAEQAATVAVGSVAQAEFADREGLPRAAKWANAQGGRYVRFDLNIADTGASVSWTVEDVPERGKYDLHLRYASDAEENAVPADEPRTVTVSAGETTTQLTLAPTDYWDDWATASTTVSLAAGETDLNLTLGEGDSGGFNLDAIALTQPGAVMPDPETDPIRGPTVPEFQFVKDVPACGWSDTRVLDSAIGEYTVTARQKDDEWYVGAMTDGNGRALDVRLDFLSKGPGKHAKGPKYVAEIYSDGIDATYDENLADVRIDRVLVNPSTTILASMVGSGGTAIRLRRARGKEIATLPTYERPQQDLSVSIPAETFVKESFITATGSNDGDYIGGTTVELVVDGDVVATENVRFPPNSSEQTDDFVYTIADPGTYDVTVRTTDGTELAAQTVRVKPPETVATLTDADGDDDGPGSYTYPTNAAFESGAFDLQSFSAAQTDTLYEFTFEVENLYNAFGSGTGFSPHMFVLWVRDPAKEGGTTESRSDLAATTEFEQPWHYRLEVSGFTKSAVNAGGGTLTTESGSAVSLDQRVDTDAGTITLTLDRAAFDGVDAANLEVIPMVQSEDRGTLRPVAESNAEWVFGGAKAGAVENAPRIVDLLTPAGVSQAGALDYSSEERATLPFVPLG
ncbi:glycoside hydrolase family 97 catalytic domain-containing protein [Haladaptatus sp. DYSN1]|uniref:glycoside hydrolase family 97 catalytic domain-containing protein n=1 Tax=unclassified Haladaptatus TaxID=2622732 RepID=UPI0024067CEE|nr:glycoside hydrolase family 97 catalytic domain-containing protein [Haladaptatus sp. DYSN1]